MMVNHAPPLPDQNIYMLIKLATCVSGEASQAGRITAKFAAPNANWISR